MRGSMRSSADRCSVDEPAGLGGPVALRPPAHAPSGPCIRAGRVSATTLDRWVCWRLAGIIAAFAAVGLLAILMLVRERFNDLEIWLAERQLEGVERVLAQERTEAERA